MQTQPQSEPSPARRTALVVRIATAGIALGLVLLAAVMDRPVVQGGAVLGWAQSGLLAAAVCLGALCFAPLSWNQNALTVLTSVGISLLVAEIVLRGTLGPQFEPIYQLDDRVLFRLVPGAERFTVLPPIHGGALIRYKINSQGFRGPELARPGEFATRVLVYGDSFIQGDFSRTQDTFTEQLKGRLARDTGKSVEVVNAGVQGYGPDQELRRMEQELPALRPHLVIVAIYTGNDFEDLLRNKLYRLSSDGSLQDNNSVVLDAALVTDMKRRRSEPILRKIMRAARIRLIGTQLVSDSREARRARWDAYVKKGIDDYRQYVIEGDNAVHTWDDPYNADVSVTPTSDSARYKIALMEQIMRRIGDTAAKNNAALMFLVIPSLIDAADQHEWAEVDLVKYPEYRRSALTDILEQICKRNGFRVVNLFSPFWERRADDLYLTGDSHWNPRGQAYAAELVSEFVSAQNLLGGPSPDTRNGSDETGKRR
jgi:hypothetical protein